jgi:hypothetical protein
MASTPRLVAIDRWEQRQTLHSRVPDSQLQAPGTSVQHPHILALIGQIMDKHA